MRTWSPGCAANSYGASQEFKKRVFQEAKFIWSGLIPRTRTSGKDRFGNFPRGLKRKALDNSEQGFLRKRRAAATAATISSRSSGDIYASAVAAGAATWSAEHQAREDKWERKREATKYSGEHTMLPEDDVDPEMLRVARIGRAKAAASAEKAKAKQKSLRRVFKKGNGHSTACLSIFVNRSVVNPGAAANR